MNLIAQLALLIVSMGFAEARADSKAAKIPDQPSGLKEGWQNSKEDFEGVLTLSRLSPLKEFSAGKANLRISEIDYLGWDNDDSLLELASPKGYFSARGPAKNIRRKNGLVFNVSLSGQPVEIRLVRQKTKSLGPISKQTKVYCEYSDYCYAYGIGVDTNGQMVNSYSWGMHYNCPGSQQALITYSQLVDQISVTFVDKNKNVLATFQGQTAPRLEELKRQKLSACEGDS